jgi:hypothetical protein
MVTVNIKVEGLDALRNKLSAQAKQIPYATSRAINSLAYIATQDAKTEIKKVFDRVTPWVAGSVRYSKSNKNDLRSTIDLDYWGNKQGVSVEQVLKAEIYGGARRQKRHEIALERAGILPAGMRIVPGSAAKMDAYGNMTSGQIVQIISWFQGFGEQGYQANISDKRKKFLARDKKKSGVRGFEYFLMTRKGQKPVGIFQRIKTGFGSAIKPVMIFVTRTNYKKRFDFDGIVQKSLNKNSEREIEKAIDDALRTAR